MAHSRGLSYGGGGGIGGGRGKVSWYPSGSRLT